MNANSSTFGLLGTRALLRWRAARLQGRRIVLHDQRLLLPLLVDLFLVL